MKTDSDSKPKIYLLSSYRTISPSHHPQKKSWSPFRDWRVLVGLIVIGAVTIGLTAFMFREGPDEQWAAMLRRIGVLQSEAQSRSVARSVLIGEPRPGNSWDDYKFALDDAQSWAEDPNGSLLTDFITGSPNSDPVKAEKMISSHKAAIEHLRQGARRQDGQFPYKWAYDDEMQIPSLNAARLLGALAVAQAKVWDGEGRTWDAVELLLDLSVFARDLANNGPLTTNLAGGDIYSIAFDQLRNLIVSGKLPQTQIAELDKKLATMDHDLPGLSATLANETLATSATAMKSAKEDWWQLVKQNGWRYGFSTRRMTVDAFEQRDSYLKRSRNIDQLDFAAAKEEAMAIEAEVDKSTNPMIRLSTLSLTRAIVKQRETLARLRLLRAATGALATGKVPTLGDPFGTTLHSVERLQQLRIWSNGSDGTDDEGHGGWDSPLPHQDIVIDVVVPAALLPVALLPDK